MIWLPLVAAAAIAVVLYVLHVLSRRREVDGAKVYRARFVQLAVQLETVTRAVNQLEPLARMVREPRLLDYYEGTLRLLENLLQAITKLPPFGSEPAALDAAFFLVRDFRHRVGRTQQAFEDATRGREVRLDELYGAASPKRAVSGPTGCYFCSRPVIADRFSRVKVRLDGQVREVTSCKVCRDELEQTKKVKVLYFMKEGKPVHWSEVKDYHPSEDFWNINRPDAVRRTTKLELIYSQPSRPLDSRE